MENIVQILNSHYWLKNSPFSASIHPCPTPNTASYGPCHPCGGQGEKKKKNQGRHRVTSTLVTTSGVTSSKEQASAVIKDSPSGH